MTIKSILNNIKVFDLLRARSSYIIGIDIGSSTLKIMGLRVGQAPSLSFYSIVDIPKDAGDKFIVESIQKALKDNNITTKDSVLTFSDESIAIRRIELPHIAHNEIPSALRWQAKDLVGFDVEKASLDFKILGETQREDGSKFMELLFVAVPGDVMEKSVQILKEAGLNVISVNVAPFALENIMKIREEGSGPSGTALVVDFGCAKTEVSAFKNNALEFVRTIPVGSGDVSEAIAAATLTTEKGNVKLSRDEAEDLKMRLGIPYEPTTLESGVTSIQILSLMRPVLERLSKELKRSIDYYVQEYGEEGAISVCLVGGGSRLKNLDKYLSEELNLPVKRMGLPGIIDVSKANFKEEDSPSIASLVGAILGYRRELNLLPHEYRVEKIEFFEKISLRMIAIIVGSLLLVSFFFIKFRVDNYRYRLKNALVQNNIVNQISQLQDRVTERSAFLNQAKMRDLPLDYVMKEVSNIISQNIVLDSLSINQKAKTLDMRGIIYEPRGSAEDTLTKFMEALEKSKYFKDAQLVSVQATAATAEESSNFEINCLLE